MVIRKIRKGREDMATYHVWPGHDDIVMMYGDMDSYRRRSTHKLSDLALCGKWTSMDFMKGYSNMTCSEAREKGVNCQRCMEKLYKKSKPPT